MKEKNTLKIKQTKGSTYLIDGIVIRATSYKEAIKEHLSIPIPITKRISNENQY